MFNYQDKIVITTVKFYHSFSVGDRGEVLERIGENCYLIESNNEERIVKAEDIRSYDSIDEYDDMYCDVCGGTACMC
jgi:hypothetical protein